MPKDLINLRKKSYNCPFMVEVVRHTHGYLYKLNVITKYNPVNIINTSYVASYLIWSYTTIYGYRM